MKHLLSPLLLLVPNLVFAQGLEFRLRSPFCSYDAGGAVISCGITSIEGLITTILNILLVLSVPIIVFFIIFAGFSYVTAQGNAEKIKVASRSLTYALIGAVLILGAVTLAEIIKGIVTSLGT